MPNPKGAPLSVPSPSESTTLTLPPLLKPGDRVALFNPGAHGGKFPPEWPGKAMEVLESWGLRPEPPTREAPRHLYFSATDPQRAEAFPALYCDVEIKAPFAGRGGSGTARSCPFLGPRRVAWRDCPPPTLSVGPARGEALPGVRTRRGSRRSSGGSAITTKASG